jgi:hypothetical protein
MPWESFNNWLLSQTAVVIVMGFWLMSEKYERRRSSKESSTRIQSLEARNAELSDSLVAMLRESSRETSERELDERRSIVTAIELALESKRRASPSSSTPPLSPPRKLPPAPARPGR